jgi:hypothetical protein
MQLEVSPVGQPGTAAGGAAAPEAEAYGAAAAAHKVPAANVGVAKPATNADPGAVLLGYGAVALGAVIGIALWSWRNPSSFTPGSGISVFAPLYILAQAIERFIEPFSSFLGATTPDTSRNAAKETKADAMEHVHRALAAADADGAAQWQRLVDQIRRNTAVITWGLASFLGIVLCGLFGLYMLRMVGFTGVPEQADLVISGLAVGSGTKPLHDLISNLQQSKAQKEDPPEKKAI